MVRGTWIKTEGKGAQTGPTWGQCQTCGAAVGRTAMAKHVAACLAAEEKATDAVLFTVDGRGFFGTYWLHAAVKSDATLGAIDRLLRATWLECCGHMSEFRGAAKGTRAGDLPKGVSFGYEYDFGSTTALKLKVAGPSRVAFPGRASARLLARNLPLALACDECGERATLVCAQCAWGGKPLVCKACGPDHECGDDMLLPLANSPRAGVCGYTGED